MALYLGSEKVKINLGGVAYHLNLFVNTSIANGDWLLSSDNYVLQDSNGIYLISKDSSIIISENVLLSYDNYVLQDSNGIYLISKENE